MNKKYVLFSVLAFVIILLSFYGYSQASGDEITVCVKKGGAVFMIGENFRRADCSKNEKLVSWNMQGVQGEKGEKGDTGDIGEAGLAGQSGASLHLMDGSGQDLGLLTGVSNGVYDSFLPEKDVYFRLVNGASVVNWNVGHFVFFTEPNCAGTALINTNFVDSQLLVRAGNLANGGVRYFKPTNATSPINQWRSVLAINTACNNESDQSQFMYVLNEITVPFQEPLVFPLKIKMQ